MADDTKNIFISHIHEDDEGLGRLKDLIRSHGMTPRDYSINADNPNNAHDENHIKSSILAPRIRQSSTLVVYISRETKNSPWVDWEIEYAHKHDKRIVGVWADGERGCEVPDSLDKLADAVVGWTGNRIIDAIEGRIDSWENPDGTPHPLRDIPRAPCR
jgi:hypothetical protein